MNTRILFPDLWKTLSHNNTSILHGPDHWERVRQHGLAIAENNGAEIRVVELFALLHDYCRQNEGYDRDHGRRAAEYARKNRDSLPKLDDDAFDALVCALAGHADGQTTEDPNVGACWDADRLDLGRAGIPPSPHYMSTAEGKRMADN